MNKLSFLFITAVTIFAMACQNAPKGEKAVTEAAKKVANNAAASAANATYKVESGSTIMWTGTKLAGPHTGTLNVSTGTVNVKDGKVTGGKFFIDMGSLTVTDLEAGKGKEKLEGHLKSADFFDVANNPEATFEITAVEGGNVTGNLTMMGVTKSITFPADIKAPAGGVSVKTPNFTINRTDWGLKYGSASFFDGLKDKAINDEIGLQIRLRAR